MFISAIMFANKLAEQREWFLRVQEEEEQWKSK